MTQPALGAAFRGSLMKAAKPRRLKAQRRRSR
jgi:hypothetical protein